MYSKYAGAFATPVVLDACTQLRTDKWNVCHPTGEKSSAPVCTSDMDASMLQELYDSHMQCYTYRKLENESHCFSSKDSGHQKAQKVEWKRANTCLDFLKQTVAKSHETRHERLEADEPEKDVEEEEQDVEADEDVEAQNQEKEKKKPKSFWNFMVVMALILFAIFLIFLFVFYVV